jgi:Secretory pathway protein Sec39
LSLHVLDDPTTISSTSSAIKLISATHALSHYSLFTAPGTAINAAQIRKHKDPAQLLIKIIESGPLIYRDCDKLIKILNDFIDGTQLFTTETRYSKTREMQARVYVTVVNAALSANDFIMAYNICIHKLSELTSAEIVIPETTWLAFYRAGIYSGRLSHDSTEMSTILVDFQKMELLAHAILLCPKEQISEIVSRWTALENRTLHPELVQPPQSSNSRSSRDHRNLLTTSAQQERNVEHRESPLIRKTDEENSSPTLDENRVSGEFDTWRQSSSRFGVRDTVKAGLTQGIGWLLGATPQADSQVDDSIRH